MYGAGGGIGTFAVQVGKLLGTRVTAVASAGKHERLTGLGADALLDYRKTDSAKAREEWDDVFDFVPSHTFGQCAPVLAREGIHVTTLPGARPFFASVGTSLRALFGFRKRCRRLILRPRYEDLCRLVERAGEGKLRPMVGRAPLSTRPRGRPPASPRVTSPGIPP